MGGDLADHEPRSLSNIAANQSARRIYSVLITGAVTLSRLVVSWPAKALKLDIRRARSIEHNVCKRSSASAGEQAVNPGNPDNHSMVRRRLTTEETEQWLERHSRVTSAILRLTDSLSDYGDALDSIVTKIDNLVVENKDSTRDRLAELGQQLDKLTTHDICDQIAELIR